MTQRRPRSWQRYGILLLGVAILAGAAFAFVLWRADPAGHGTHAILYKAVAARQMGLTNDQADAYVDQIAAKSGATHAAAADAATKLAIGGVPPGQWLDAIQAKP